MSVHLKSTKLVLLLLISLLAITRSTDRYDTISYQANPSLAFVNETLTNVPAQVFLFNNPAVIQQDESLFSTARRCFSDTFSENLGSITNFRSLFPYVTIVVAIISFVSNPFLIFTFLFIKQTFPTLACTFLPVSLFYFIVRYYYQD